MATIIDMMRFRSGPSRFEALVRPHLSAMYSAAYRFSRNPADAEDLVQDVLVKLYPKRQEMAKVEKLRSWLMTVLYRTFVDRKRKHDRAPTTLVSLINRDDSGHRDFFDSVASELPGPEESVDQFFTRQRIQQALGALNENQRILCVLHDMEGYTLNELSEMLGSPVGTLKSRLHRARARLRHLLSEGTIQKVQTSLHGER